MISPSMKRLILIVLLGLAVAGAWRLARRESAELGVAREIRVALTLDSAASRTSRFTRASVVEFYRRRHWRPAWCDGERPDGRAYELVRSLDRLAREGLDPADYRAPELAALLQRLPQGYGLEPRPRPDRLADLDVRLTAAFLRCIPDLDHGRLSRAALDPDWAPADTLAPVEYALRAVRRHRVERAIVDLLRRDREYLALREALLRYRRLAARGGWRPLPGGPELKRGASGAAVESLAVRLAREDDGTPAGAVDANGERRFDAALERAVRAFQSRHGLEPTGRLDPATRAALDRPAAERVRQIELNLERRRWIPREFHEPYVFVNIPDFHLDLMDQGRSVMQMRVVVGRRDNPTPVFSDTLVYLEMNPMWRLPRRILVEEVLPAWRKDPLYFDKNQMRVLWTGGPRLQEIRPDSIDWTPVEDDTFEFIVRQDAGPENPLGRIKFMCPNEYDVYLHDTPARQYFAAGARDRSHGCVRVEHPLELAGTLLADTTLGTRDSIDAILASGNWRRIRLKQRMPVHVLYWTAWVDSAGAVQFRDDVYDLDRRLDAALREGRASEFVINPALEWGEKHRTTVDPSTAASNAADSSPGPMAALRPREPRASPTGAR